MAQDAENPARKCSAQRAIARTLLAYHHALSDLSAILRMMGAWIMQAAPLAPLCPFAARRFGLAGPVCIGLLARDVGYGQDVARPVFMNAIDYLTAGLTSRVLTVRALSGPSTE